MALSSSITISASEAARRLDISQRHLTRLAVAGRLDFVRTPYGRAYTPAEVERLASERAEQRRGTN